MVTTLKTSDIRRALLRIGFEELGTEHKRFRLKTGGREPIGTRFSHGVDEVWGGRINQMAKQLHVEKDEFVALVEGRLDREWYLLNLRKKGLIEEGSP